MNNVAFVRTQIELIESFFENEVSMKFGLLFQIHKLNTKELSTE